MDDVINVHREVIYKLRRKILFAYKNKGEFEDWFLPKLQAQYDFDAPEKWEKPLEKFKSEWFNIVSTLCLPVVDLLWMDHLSEMDHLREGIGLRGYAQRDPIVEYKRESHVQFELLVAKMYNLMAERLSNVTIEATSIPASRAKQTSGELNYQTGAIESGVGEEVAATKTQATTAGGIKVSKVLSNKEKIGRNDLCPCGSGLKYKNCGLINSSKHRS